VADIADNAAPLIDASKSAAPDRHRLYEDAMAMLIGTSFIALGITLYSQATLMTGAPPVLHCSSSMRRAQNSDCFIS